MSVPHAGPTLPESPPGTPWAGLLPQHFWFSWENVAESSGSQAGQEDGFSFVWGDSGSPASGACFAWGAQPATGWGGLGGPPRCPGASAGA